VAAHDRHPYDLYARAAVHDYVFTGKATAQVRAGDRSDAVAAARRAATNSEATERAMATNETS
jgi:hypothetical protein